MASALLIRRYSWGKARVQASGKWPAKVVTEIVPAGWQLTGLVCTDGIFLDDEQVADRDKCTTTGHLAVLTSAKVDRAVLRGEPGSRGYEIVEQAPWLRHFTARFEPLAAPVDPARPIREAEAKDAVHEALSALPTQVRKALELREFEGLRYREIGAVMDLSLNEVKVLLHRGRKLLARRLARMGVSDIAVGYFFPIPNTELFRELLAEGRIELDDRFLQTAMFANDPILAERKVGVIHNPTSNMKIASGIAPITDMLAAGVRVGLGTDGAASNNDLDLWEEMRLAAFLQKVEQMNPEVLSAETVLRMATSGGATAIGLGDKTGSLEAGKRADLIQVAFEDVHHIPTYDVVSHLVYVNDEQDVASVVVDGVVLMKEREMLTIDTGRVAREATELAARIQSALDERNQ